MVSGFHTGDFNPIRTVPMLDTHKALVPTAGAALSAMPPVTLTRLPVSTLTPAPAVGTA